MPEFLQIIILGLVEGLTEFIPVSSTGHLIIAGHFLGFEGEKAATFDVFIQLGAILSVLFLYRERFANILSFRKAKGFSGLRGVLLLGLTTLPALVFGALAHRFIKQHLFTTLTVAIGLCVGGIVILAVERLLPQVRKTGLDALGWRDALAIGIFQCLALWPGVSRSAATIVGGLSIGIERKTAAEYSFFAAVPVMFAATAYDLYKSLPFLDASDIPAFSTGFLVSFLSALVAIRFFMKIIQRHTLNGFGVYRIVLSLLLFTIVS